VTALLPLGLWVPILDGDDAARILFERHYSAAASLRLRQERGTRLFAGPGWKLVLSTPCRRALFVWRKFRPMNDQEGINCAIFRNESPLLSSRLIRAADAIADAYWPGEWHYTYVSAAKTASRRSRHSPPGACFIHAGWRLLPEVTKKRGLAILERTAPIRSLPSERSSTLSRGGEEPNQ
jgi:hypothetical protein